MDMNEVDAGIKEVLQLLLDAGYETITSCEGGEGHCFDRPTVGIKLQGEYFEFRDKLAKLLMRQYSHFSINHKTSYNPISRKTGKRVWWQYVYLEFPSKKHLAVNHPD